MVRFVLLSAVLALACLAMPQPAAAQDTEILGDLIAANDQQTKATLELIVPRGSVRPGEKIPVGVKFTMAPGWHIYWKNPGDSGMAPAFRWSMPGGGASRAMRGSEWTATEPQFPVPVRWEDAGGLTGFGYTDSVIFPAEVTVPASATPGQEVELGVHAQYLVCKEICLSEQQGASVRLRVSAESVDEEQQQEQRDAAAALEAAKERMPQQASEAKVEPGEDGTMKVSVALPGGAEKVDFFPNPPDGLVAEDVKVSKEGGRAVAEFRLRTLQGAEVEAKAFEAVFGYDTNDGRRGVSVSVPVPSTAGAGDAKETGP